jgi:hypothetical protein
VCLVNWEPPAGDGLGAGPDSPVSLATPVDSEHFRLAPGTCRSAGGRLRVRRTGYEGEPSC